ncbi:MAG: VWA domain-containing protein [Phycisphaerales bacterium]|nr:VWA domain-containing protein [Planctomycetota bacterium]MCH8508844.1 VWA domain-containing protein [Phycisphaerales bacterium]
MNTWLNRIFGLDGLGFGTPDAELVLERPLPEWVWALLIVAALLLAWWTYRGLPGPKAGRAAMGFLRGVIIVILVLLAAGPQLRLEQMRTEADRVFVLVDRSASMQVPDGPGAITRDAQALAAVERAEPALLALGERSEVVRMAFGSSTRAVGDEGFGPADEPATLIGDALGVALDAARGGPIGGIVLLTDGRSTDPIPASVRRRLESERVPVFPVPLGSPDPVRSAGIDQTESPGVAFADDTVPVRARVVWSGGVPEGARVQLVDRSTGEVLDETALEGIEGDEADGSGSAWVTMTTTPRAAGPRDLEARLVGVADDIDPDDNTARVPLEVVDRPIRVLYVDGHPRWEHRYVKNLLIRERSIDSTVLLLASGRRYTQEGDTLIARLPVSSEEWAEFDVVILGDLSPDLFGTEQLVQLTEHVAQRGAGVLWMGGPGSTPRAWFDSPAGDLLPMRAGSVRVWNEPVTLRAVPEADRLGVLRTDEQGAGWDERLTNPGAGWTVLRWAQRLSPEGLKPGALVLAEAAGVDSGSSAPVVVTMRFGSGRSAFVGTDEIWRWRYGRGETLPERFWIPLVRMLARGRVAGALGPGLLTVTPDRPEPGTPSLIELEVFDQSVIDRLPERVTVRVVRADGREASVTLRGEGSTRSGVWTPDTPGAVRVEMGPGLPELMGLAAEAAVIEPGDERRNLNTDHELLEELARRTGGRLVAWDQTERLAEWVPNRARVHAGAPIIETLWDRWVVLLGLLALLTLEWVGRRLARLA